MCPLISPASNACSSFILLLISECPAFHMMARPPCFSMSSYSVCEHLTSPTMAAPGRSASTSREKRIMSWSPQRMLPFSSMAPIRSASPSQAMPTSALQSATFFCRSRRFASTVGSGW